MKSISIHSLILLSFLETGLQSFFVVLILLLGSCWMGLSGIFSFNNVVKINHFAFPFGTFDSINQKALKILDKNYDFIHSGLRGNNKKTTKLIFRDAVNPEMKTTRLKAFLIGNADLLYKRNFKKLNRHLS